VNTKQNTRKYRARCGHREGCILATWPKYLRWRLRMLSWLLMSVFPMWKIL